MGNGKQSLHLRVWLTVAVPARAIVVAAFLALLFAASAAAAAGPGSLDTSFGSGGYATVSLGSWVGAAAVVVQPDGKIVTAGEAGINGVDYVVATRMLSNGQLDSSFGVGGIVTVGINGAAGVDSGDALALQSDGKIVIAAGGRDGQYGPIMFAAVRLNTNGSLDQSFGSGGIASVAVGSSYAIANGVAIESDGKIVLAGTALIGHKEFAAARLNPDGSIDTSFGNGGVTTLSPNGGAWGVIVQSNGSVVMAGQTDYNNPQVQGAQQFMAARLRSDGTPDPTFGRQGIAMIPVGATALGYGIAQTSSGKVLVAGSAFTNTGVAAVVRLNTNGTLDRTFGSGGIATLPDWQGVNGIILDSFGRIVLPAVGASAVRLNTNGSADTSFGTRGIAQAPLGTQGGANGAAIQADGKIVLAGAADVNGQTVLTVIRLWAGPIQ